MQIKDKKILVLSKIYNEEDVEIEELKELILTAEGNFCSFINQINDEINTATYFGKGKLEFIKNVASELGVECVQIAEDITPVQLSNLIDYLEVPVMDRTMLILEIFNMRATTHIAKLQVELAEKSYMYPRLKSLRDNYDREGGSGKTRGKGEQKLELDRRNYRDKVNELKRNLKELKKKEELKSKKRIASSIPLVAMIGYSNVGKSTILNKLIEHSNGDEKLKVYADDKLFATLEPSSRLIKLSTGKSFILSDTVGLISNLPHGLVEAFSSTLQVVKDADLILEIRDISNENLYRETETTNMVLDELKVIDNKRIIFYNKKDLIENNSSVFAISALNDDDIKKLISIIEERLFGKLIKVTKKFVYEETKEMFNYANDLIDSKIIYEDDFILVEGFVYEK